jgi:hypothetical protein
MRNPATAAPVVTSSPPRRRPPERGKHGGRPDSHQLTVRFSAEERALLEVKANAAGLSPSAYIRAMALGSAGLRAVRRPPIERTALVELLAKVGRIGGNLYQLSRAANYGEPIAARAVVALVIDLRALTNEIRVALGRKPL